MSPIHSVIFYQTLFCWQASLIGTGNKFIQLGIFQVTRVSEQVSTGTKHRLAFVEVLVVSPEILQGPCD